MNQTMLKAQALVTYMALFLNSFWDPHKTVEFTHNKAVLKSIVSVQCCNPVSYTEQSPCDSMEPL